MIYSQFKEDSLSLLGFGAMRLPQKPDGSVDERATEEMIRYAMEHGVNYFDTAYPYHDGESERIVGRALSAYPRESYRIATKYPGHQIAESYDPAAIFEEQLKKCGVEYFDYYLLHNIYENSIRVYTDPRWGILDYFKEQKRLGRIRHLGFSCHGDTAVIKAFLDYAGGAMEFCQIQLNYLDWTLQHGKEKYELLAERGMPVWVMEPVRGGKLADLPDGEKARLAAHRPGESVAAWGFRFLQGLPNVAVVLSGMSNLAQMKDNVATFAERKPLSAEEQALALSIADGMKDSIPCTGCRYCCSGCPMGLDIPFFLSVYNEIRFSPATSAAMRIEWMPEEKRPAACIGCGKCAESCPQGIGVPQHMRDLAGILPTIPSWAEICRQRAASQKR